MRKQRQRKEEYLPSVTQLVGEWPGFKQKQSPTLTITLFFLQGKKPCFHWTFILSFTQAGWCVGRRVDFGIRKPRNHLLEDLGLVPEPLGTSVPLPELLQRLNGNCNTG